MGKASKWFRALLGLKRSDPNPNQNQAQKPPPKKKWGFGRSHKDKDRQKSKHGGAAGAGDDDDEATRHAMAVAAATAAVAEAAVAAAQAAAAVVKLTSAGGSTQTMGSLNTAAYVGQRGAHYVNPEEWAAVTIQSHFRAYLSRRALRALRALVKLQALVRGHLLRKHTANALRQMQAIVRAQARARAGRAMISEVSQFSTKSPLFSHTEPVTPEKFEHITQGRSMKHEQLIMLKRNGSKSNGNILFSPENSNFSRNRMDRRAGGRSWEQGSFARTINPTGDERSVKILEVDTGKPHTSPTRKNNFRSSNLSHTSHQYCQRTLLSSSSGEVQSFTPLKFAQDDVDENAFWTADNSPQYYSASSMGGSSRRGAFTPPTKSDGSRSCLSGYSDHPNYMANTESSKAKLRSFSAPKQRPSQHERSSSMNRYSVHGYGDLKANPQKVPANFNNKFYPGSGYLDRFGMPVRGDVSQFSG